jgi:hypothetical protein
MFLDFFVLGSRHNSRCARKAGRWNRASRLLTDSTAVFRKNRHLLQRRCAVPVDAWVEGAKRRSLLFTEDLDLAPSTPPSNSSTVLFGVGSKREGCREQGSAAAGRQRGLRCGPVACWLPCSSNGVTFNLDLAASNKPSFATEGSLLEIDVPTINADI